LIQEKTETISDYAPREDDANIVPFIRGESVVVKDKFKRKRRLNEGQKFAAILASILLVIVAALILLPWIFKMLLLFCCYAFIAIVSKGGDYSIPSRGGSRGKSVPGSAIVPRS